MIDVLLTRSDFERARARAERKKALLAGSKCTYYMKAEKDLIGLLGEIAFAKYLKQIEADFSEYGEIMQKGVGDRWDFKLKAAGQYHYFDVKTSTRYDTIAVNARQADLARKHGARLVCVRLDQKASRAQIIGHASPDDLKRDSAKDFTYNGARVEMYSVPAWALRRFKVDEIVVS